MRFVDGRHTYKNDTPIYCQKCGALLPRPTMVDKVTGERRRIKGFDSAYKRMSWDTPAPTLTQSYFCVPPVAGQDDENWYKAIIKYEVAPLLDEYWWDDKEKAEDCIKDLLKD